MTELVLKQFEMTRNRFIKEIDSIPVEALDIQPKGFNNTIHWHIGHIITVAEGVLFGKSSHNIPTNYGELYASGTKPADWTGNVPTLVELTEQLTSQLNRIKEISASKLAEKLDEPFLGCETYAELVNFVSYHEALHQGQIHAMNRIVQL